jgi:RNA polymerase sigma-70 factor (ECF subfamily)
MGQGLPQRAQDAQNDADAAQLVRRLQAGEESAFDELYQLYLTPLYGYMVIALRDHYEAQDAAHEVFVKMLTALPRYVDRGLPFRIWLFRIARNHLLDRKARLARVDAGQPADLQRLLDERTDNTAAEAPLRRLSDEDFLKLLERLPLLQRQVLVLRYAFDLQFDDIGLSLDVTPGYARTLHRRAFARLRPRLEEESRGTGRVSRLAMRLRPAPRMVLAGRLRALL